MVSLTVNLEKTSEEQTVPKAEIDELCAKPESIAEEHRNTPIKVCEERQGELASLRATASQRETPIAKVRDDASSEVTKMRSECNSAAARDHPSLGVHSSCS